MADNDSDFGAFLSGFVLGGLVGAAVALLLAPQTGEETRAVIREKSIELRDTAYEQADVVKTKAGEVATQAKSKAGEVADQAKSKAGEVVDSAKGKATDIGKRGQVVLEEQKERLSTAIEAGKKVVKRGTADGGEEPTEA